MEGDRDIVMEFESTGCIRNLGGRLMLTFVRAGISFYVVVVLVMEVVFFRERSLSPKSNIGQAKTHWPKLVLRDVMCGFPRLL